MTTYLFPGQGSQVKGMGNDLFSKYPELTKQADEVLGYSIKALCLEDESNNLNKTQFTQPALYVVNALAYQEKLKVGPKPDFLAGHSLGEYNALQAAGVFSFVDGLALVKKRGELMSRAPKGAMAAVLNMSAVKIRQYLDKNKLDDIDIANYNSPSQIIISGLEDDIYNAQSIFENDDVVFIPLNTSGAFHSRYMEPIKAEFSSYLASFNLFEPQIPVISNIHAKPYSPQHIAQNLSEQITHSVDWLASMRYLLDQGEDSFEELGVGNVLTKFITSIKLDFEKSGLNTNNNKDSLNEKNKDNAANEVFHNDNPVEKIKAWNKSCPIGTRVDVKGYDEFLETRTEALMLFGHRAAVYLKSYNGYFALDEVLPVA